LDIVRYYLNLLALKTGKGQGLVEYALIIVLISIVAITIMTTLGGSITSVFSRANSSLTAPYGSLVAALIAATRRLKARQASARRAFFTSTWIRLQAADRPIASHQRAGTIDAARREAGHPPARPRDLQGRCSIHHRD
jgi:pilus assembly protein Flp/PilA